MRVVLVTGVYPGERTGGAEVQTMLIGKGLAQREHQVLFLATEAGRNQETVTEDGIIVRELVGWARTSMQEHEQQIDQILADFSPDVCYVRLLMELATVSRLCRAREVPVVSISVSLMETAPILKSAHWRDTVNFWRTKQPWHHYRSFQAIRHSAVHLCNTKEMAELCERWLPNTPVRTIYNAAPEAPENEIHRTPGKQIIWVNNLKRLKRPEVYVDLAHALPQYDFLMIGAIPASGRYAAYARHLIDAAPPNLTYLGYQPLEVVNRNIGNSDLLLYTSINEGFGNSFLQAWFRAVPTGSLSSRLDGILEREKIGFFAETFDDLKQEVDRLMTETDERMAIGRSALEYAQRHHSIDGMIDAYEDLFIQASDDRSAQRSRNAAGQPVFSQTAS